MNKQFFFSCLLCCCSLLAFAVKQPKILVFSKTAGFRHSSIDVGKRTFIELGKKYHFDVDTSEDASVFNKKSLKQYKAVVFLNTTGDIFNGVQQEAFQQYIRSGGGFVGVHAATDTEFDWPWFGRFIGAYFTDHPQQQVATTRVVDPDHPATAHLPKEWIRKDEWYNFKDIRPGIRILMLLDESTYKGGKNGREHPLAWCQEFEGGRMFYTAMGHTEASYDDPLFLQHLWGGLQYAFGKNSFKSK